MYKFFSILSMKLPKVKKEIVRGKNEMFTGKKSKLFRKNGQKWKINIIGNIFYLLHKKFKINILKFLKFPKKSYWKGWFCIASTEFRNKNRNHLHNSHFQFKPIHRVFKRWEENWAKNIKNSFFYYFIKQKYKFTMFFCPTMKLIKNKKQGYYYTWQPWLHNGCN